jgi:hypothetical protein
LARLVTKPGEARRAGNQSIAHRHHTTCDLLAH